MLSFLSSWLIALLATALFLGGMLMLLQYRLRRRAMQLAEQALEGEARLCGCQSACDEHQHLYQIGEPQEKQPL